MRLEEQTPVPTASRMKRWVRMAGRCYAGLSAGLLVYVTVMGLAGFAVTRAVYEPHEPPDDCLPYRGYMEVIDSACPSRAVSVAWMLLLGIPRIVVVVLNLTRITAIYHSHGDLIGQAFVVLRCLAILTLLFGPGFLFWLRRRAVVAWLAGAVLFGEALAFGAMR